MPRTKQPEPYEGPRQYDRDAAGWNAGMPWGDWEIYDLIYEYQRGDSVEDIRISTQRNRNEVESKIEELGLDKMTRSQLMLR